MKNIICTAIDVGTTTLCAVVLDVTNAKQLESFTVENNSVIPALYDFEHKQDADVILELAKELLDKIIDKYPDVSSIGFTGQMHGMLYIDKDGKAVSPLWTWQDARGNCICDKGMSYAAVMSDITGYGVAAGFGLVTHYYNMKNSLVPDEAVSFCSIMDYLAMRFSGNSKPVLHPSVAASFGVFDVEKGEFDRNALRALGIDIGLPGVTHNDEAIGSYRGIPIAPAIGDNQASVFGSVKDEESSVLVNYGTGSQVSVICDMTQVPQPLEVRPYITGKNLVCGCALCGGSSFALLEGFFRGYAKAVGIEGNQYRTMDVLADKAYNEGMKPLSVSTLFKGTRSDGSVRGSVSGIGVDNFTPEQLILGVIKGMADELYDMYKASGVMGKTTLVASGNGVQKNTVLQKLLTDIFGMELMLPANGEEASMGAAMYSALCCNDIEMAKLKECIAYK